MARAKRPPQTKKKLGGPRVSEGGPRRDKVAAVEDIQSRFSSASAVVLTEYRGMTVAELAELRTQLREAGADFKVYKNTLASIAARNVGAEEIVEHLQGPTGFAFATEDPVLLAKKLSDYAKKVPALVLKGGLLENKVLSGDDVDRLAKLESREVMLSKMAGMFLSPIQQVANLFSASFNQLGAVLAQLRDKLEAEGGAPAPAAEAADAPAAEAPAPEGDQQDTPAEAPAEPAAEATADDAAAPSGDDTQEG